MKGGLKYLALITQLGLTIVFAVLISVAVGVFLDRILNTRFIFTLLFIVIGGAAGVWSAYHLIQKISVDDLER